MWFHPSHNDTLFICALLFLSGLLSDFCSLGLFRGDVGTFAQHLCGAFAVQGDVVFTRHVSCGHDRLARRAVNRAQLG